MFSLAKSLSLVAFLALFVNLSTGGTDPSQKPGTCPVYAPPAGGPVMTSCIAKCSNDSWCGCSQKCCSRGCTRLCVNPIPPKSGYCPQAGPLFAKGVNKPLQSCTDDNECDADLKCCARAAYNRFCVKPTDVMPPAKPGNCPAVMLGAMACRMFDSPPVDACKSDDECGGDTKCCNTACCKRQCTKPVGICPAKNDEPKGRCNKTDECSSTSPCATGMKCCTTRCGTICA